MYLEVTAQLYTPTNASIGHFNVRAMDDGRSHCKIVAHFRFFELI